MGQLPMTPRLGAYVRNMRQWYTGGHCADMVCEWCMQWCYFMKGVPIKALATHLGSEVLSRLRFAQQSWCDSTWPRYRCRVAASFWVLARINPPAPKHLVIRRRRRLLWRRGSPACGRTSATSVFYSSLQVRPICTELRRPGPEMAADS